MTDADALGQFRAAATARGLILPDQLRTDGTIERVPVENDRPGRLSGSYLLHLDGRPAGGFQNFRDGHGWQNWRQDGPGRAPDDAAAWREKTRTLQAQREAEQRRRQELAAERALALWRRAGAADPEHPYLVRKGVAPNGIRQLGGSLVIPMRSADGHLWNLQFIGPDGAKRFLKSGQKTGCYCAIGELGRVICICEGFATGASIHAATGHAVAVAFDCGNLKTVAIALRARFPDHELVICADNDVVTPGNPGVTHATAAARATCALLAIPRFDTP